MAHDEPMQPGSGAPKKRPPFTTVGFPKRPDARKLGWAWSLIAHILILLLLLAPALVRTVIPEEFSTGAGGEGPAGGGGGGTNGDGGRDMFENPEALRYIRVAPEPAATATPEPPVEPTPVAPPVTPPTPEPQPTEPRAPELAALLPDEGPRVLAGTGTGGGTGNDGTAGNGPGTGGGIGSGVGTGTGSGVGPGTGGGTGDVHPPTPIQVFLPPLPAPDRIGKPYQLVAYFEVDETGKSTLLRFNESRDRGYNRELKQRLEQMRFRPAVRPDGTPVKQVFPLTVWIY